jgi:hypothetical protein
VSTVLWSNQLLNGVVISDESDKSAMQRHLQKLDSLCEASGVATISSFCDSTDAQCNLEILELPEGMDSTNALMAEQGVWIEADEAVKVLDTLIHKIRSEGTRFGLLRNDHDQILDELQESYDYAKSSAERGGKFNFSVVM